VRRKDPNDMSIVHTKATADDRKTRTAELRKHHEPVFEALEVPDALFIPKSQYKPHGKDELYIGMFQSELRKAVDIYTEAVSYEIVSEDPERKLYKWNYNPHWDSEYEVATSEASNIPRYLIPVAELTIVEDPTYPFKKDINEPMREIKETKKVENKNIDIFGSSDLEDVPLNQVTLRDIAAILLREPCSTREWLNSLIVINKSKTK
jgi:hypothetical protein